LKDQKHLNTEVSAFFRKFATNGGKVLVGLSGGADSTALVCALCAMRDALKITVACAHINHGIRGTDADRDEAFAQSLAERLGCEFHSMYADVPRLAREQKLGLEETARKVRYDYFDRLCREEGYDFVAVAHNANDNLETMLFHLARGTGLAGMAGISPVRGNIIRPFLNVTRDEIINYLSEIKQDYVTDQTNFDTNYARNKIRSDVVPALLSINSGAIQHASALAEISREYLELAANEAKKLQITEKNDRVTMNSAEIACAPAPVAAELLQIAFARIANGTLSAQNISDMIKTAASDNPSSVVNLPDGVVFRREYEICVLLRQNETAACESFCPNETVQAFGDYLISTSEQPELDKIYKKVNTLTIPRDTIKDTILVRNRAEGDRIRLPSGTKTVKRLLIDRKITRAERERIPLICDGQTVFSVVGVADSVDTKNVICALSVHIWRKI